ncbi:MAG: hypothetical protein R2851_10285 [Caldilineaceae bacterium]
MAELTRAVGAAPRGLIVCGPCCPGGDFPAAVTDLARRTSYPIMADPLSGVRYGPHTEDAPVCGAYGFLNTREPGWPDPEVILRFGAVPTSNRSTPIWNGSTRRRAARTPTASGRTRRTRPPLRPGG